MTPLQRALDRVCALSQRQQPPEMHARRVCSGEKGVPEFKALCRYVACVTSSCGLSILIDR